MMHECHRHSADIFPLCPQEPGPPVAHGHCRRAPPISSESTATCFTMAQAASRCARRRWVKVPHHDAERAMAILRAFLFGAIRFGRWREQLRLGALASSFRRRSAMPLRHVNRRAYTSTRGFFAACSLLSLYLSPHTLYVKILHYYHC